MQGQQPQPQMQNPQQPYQRPPQGYNQFAQMNQGTPAFSSRNIVATSFAHNNQNYFTNVKQKKQIQFTPKEQYQLFMDKHKKEVIIGAVILVALIFTITILAISGSQRATKVAQEQETQAYVEEVQAHRTVEEIRESINPIFKERGALMAIQEYEDQIYDAKTDEEKAMLHSERAKALFDWLRATGENYHTLILEDAYAAEELNPTWETAYDIYRYERVFGDSEASEENAQKYAKIAKERNPSLKIEQNSGGAG